MVTTVRHSRSFASGSQERDCRTGDRRTDSERRAADPILALGSLTRPRLLGPTAACLATSCALWIVPTITESGGATRFLAQLQLIFSVAWPSEPLASGLTWERAGQSALDVLFLPWAEMWIACSAVIAAAVGLFLMWRDPQIRQQLVVLIVLFGPYTVYHFLLQETGTLRYAIPHCRSS